MRLGILRDRKLASGILKEIQELASRIDEKVKFMEVCGTHTSTVFRYGIRNLLPENVTTVTGPGCPTCVTPQRRINQAVALAEDGLNVATFGDMIDVPGTEKSLAEVRAEGGEVKVVESPMQALDSEVFFAVGFDTTAPNTAVAIKKGLTILNAHKRFVPAMEALLERKDVRIDGFIDPGHVSTIIGSEPYEKLNVPQVIAGFEPLDVLMAILMLLKQIAEGRAEVEIEYRRAVRREGNPKALKVLDEVFEVGASEWRGMGEIPGSKFELKEEFSDQNAEMIYEDVIKKIGGGEKNEACSCPEILLALKEPSDCPLFRGVCTPKNPQGPCMVSSEGACGIAYHYG